MSRVRVLVSLKIHRVKKAETRCPPVGVVVRRGSYVTGMDFAYRGSDEDDIWTRTPMKRRVLCLQWPKDTNSQFAGHKFVTMTTQLPRPLTKVNV
ncbi:hypothetical protein TNCV_3790961 [Trichonephila clavipes]|nr:hypothetical protein TNCV_3790961 [Trichonephila clavipes]